MLAAMMNNGVRRNVHNLTTSSSLVVPSGVTLLYVSGTGKSGQAGADTVGSGAGGGGGAPGAIVQCQLTVAPSDTVSVTSTNLGDRFRWVLRLNGTQFAYAEDGGNAGLFDPRGGQGGEAHWQPTSTTANGRGQSSNLGDGGVGYDGNVASTAGGFIVGGGGGGGGGDPSPSVNGGNGGSAGAFTGVTATGMWGGGGGSYFAPGQSRTGSSTVTPLFPEAFTLEYD